MTHRIHALTMVFLAGATAAPALAQTADRPAADVFIEFSGGAIDRDMAAVVEAFSGESRILPTRSFIPKETTGLCPILASELSLATEFCTTEIIAAIRTLNARSDVPIDPDAISPRQGVLLPDVQVTLSEASRIYNLDQTQEAQRLRQLENNPSWRNVITSKQTDLLARLDKSDPSLPQLDQLTFRKIGWQFPISDPSRLAEAEFLSHELGGLNLSIDVERSGGFDKAAHSLSSYSALDHYHRWCVDKTAVQAEGAFADMVRPLYETKDAISCESDQPARPEIVIMDQAINPHPDLAAAFSTVTLTVPPQTEPLCSARSFDRSIDHGTLLSTIVAANANGYGFLGMEPNAVIRSFVWDRKSVTNTNLKQFIRDVLTPAKPQVYLFASEFAPYLPHPGPNAGEFEIRSAKQIWRRNPDGTWTDALVNDGVRLKGGLEREVLSSAMLLVASAGQADEGDEGREITWETPMAPQNLGDHDNLLVVGACVDCDKQTAALWPQSNRSNESRRFVSVMAPGGSEIPTYLSDQQVGETVGGTSASAAFVAGLAARMSSCYPNSYSAQPGRLKERIVLASRPVADPVAVGHVAGGVADPSVSMLDPRRSWLKLKDPAVRPVEVVKWCAERIKLADDENGPRDSLNLLSTRRLTNIDDIGLVQQSVVQIQSNQPYIKHAVKREPPARAATPEAPVASVRYEPNGPECTVTVGRLTDLFLSKEVREFGDCASITMCR